MPKITITDLFDKRMNEIRERHKLKPANLIERLREAARGRLPRLPKLPKI